MAGRKEVNVQHDLLSRTYKFLRGWQVNDYVLTCILILFVPLLSSCSNGNDTNKKANTAQTTHTVTEDKKKEAVPTYEMAGFSIVKPAVTTADVVDTMDGDTIKVKIDGKEEIVHLLLVDTPNTNNLDKPVEPWGIEANEFTKRELNGKQIGLEFDTQTRDQNGQLLAYVWLDNQLFNGTLLDHGYARIAEFPPNTKYTEPFLAIVERTRTKKSGIWSIDNYITDNGFNMEVLKAKEVSKVAPEPEEEPESKPVTKSQPKSQTKPEPKPKTEAPPQPVPPKPPRTPPADGGWHIIKTE